ncbi:MAG TPA: hypothetical protein VIW03_15430, partial [Anaeromyxobacter sp.]
EPDGAAPAPPPGTSEDQSLWKAGLEITNAIQIERARATRLQMVLANLRYADRLRILAGRDGEDGERAGRLEKRLHGAHAVQFSTLTARWPIDTYRGCGYPTMEFGSMLSHGKAERDDLDRHRALLRGCVEQAREAVKLMKESNDGLASAMMDADAALAAAGLGSPTAGLATGAPAAAAKPAAKPAAEHGEKHEAKHALERDERHGAKHEERGEKEER